MKKFTAAAAAILILLSLCSCSRRSPTVLTVGGAEINREIFVYYLDKVAERPTDYGHADTSDRAKVKQAAIDKCKKYVAVNTEFVTKGLKLTSAEKTDISEEVNNLWIRFENHYRSVGVSKQTLTKIMTCEAYEEALFTALYDKGTGDAAAEQAIKDYFYSEYVCFRTVCAYFTAGTNSKMTQQQKNDTVAAFNKMAASVSGFSDAASAAGYALSDSILLKKDSDGYPAGFFEKIAKQQANTVQVLVYDECVFAVLKEDLAAKGESLYANYRSSCIKDLYSEAAESKTAEAVAALPVEEKGRRADRLVKKYT